MSILKDAGLIKMRKEGTKNYYFDADQEAMNKIINMLLNAKQLMESLPNRNGEK